MRLSCIFSTCRASQKECQVPNRVASAERWAQTLLSLPIGRYYAVFSMLFLLFLHISSVIFSRVRVVPPRTGSALLAIETKLAITRLHGHADYWWHLKNDNANGYFPALSLQSSLVWQCMQAFV